MATYEKYGKVTFSPTAVTDKEELHVLYKRNGDKHGVCDWNTMTNKPFGDMYDSLIMVYENQFEIAENSNGILFDTKFGLEISGYYVITFDGVSYPLHVCSQGITESGANKWLTRELRINDDRNDAIFSIEDHYEYDGTFKYALFICNKIPDEIPVGTHTLRIEKTENHVIKTIPARFVSNVVTYVWVYQYKDEGFSCSHSYDELYSLLENYLNIVCVYQHDKTDSYTRYITVKEMERFDNSITFVLPDTNNPTIVYYPDNTFEWYDKWSDTQ